MEKIGKYELIRLLATGGMAEVFLAKTAGALGFEKTVVVKKIRSHLMGDPLFLQMFLNEAKIAAQLSHPNIVQVFDFGEAEEDYYLAMEYIDGPNLRTLSVAAHKAGKPLPLPLCAKIVSYTCEGLAYAHEFVNPETQQPLNIVHRDLSPDNVVLAKNGAVKVVDFGIAKAAEQLFQTQSGFRKGKLAYMSPEYLKGDQPDRRSDVFALGVVLYELISNRRPYDTENEMALMHAMIYEPIVPVRSRRADVPQDLERIVNTALARDPGARYQSCRELQADLEQFVVDHGEPLSAVHISRAIAGLQPELDAAALAKTPNRAKSPPVAGTPPLAQKTPPKKSTGSSGEKRSPSGEKRAASGEKKRNPSGEKRAGATPPRPVQVPPPEEGEERTVQVNGPGLVAQAAKLREEAERSAGSWQQIDEKAATYGEESSSARTLTMPAVKQQVVATPIKYPPAKPRSESAQTEQEMPRVQLEPAGKAKPAAKARSKASAGVQSPDVDLMAVVRQRAGTFAAVALALVLIGVALALVLRPSPPAPPTPTPQERVEVAPTPAPVPPAPEPQRPPPETPVTPEPQKPPDAPPPPKIAGWLDVTSNVQGTVKVGKQQKKMSNGHLRFELKPGKYEVELDDLVTGLWMKKVKLEIKDKETLPLSLEVAKGWALISSPSTGDADVYIDGQPMGQTPKKFELTEGQHAIRVVGPKKPQPFVDTIVIEPGKSLPVAAKYP